MNSLIKNWISENLIRFKQNSLYVLVMEQSSPDLSPNQISTNIQSTQVINQPTT